MKTLTCFIFLLALSVPAAAANKTNKDEEARKKHLRKLIDENKKLTSENNRLRRDNGLGNYNPADKRPRAGEAYISPEEITGTNARISAYIQENDRLKNDTADLKKAFGGNLAQARRARREQETPMSLDAILLEVLPTLSRDALTDAQKEAFLDNALKTYENRRIRVVAKVVDVLSASGIREWEKNKNSRKSQIRLKRESLEWRYNVHPECRTVLLYYKNEKPNSNLAADFSLQLSDAEALEISKNSNLTVDGFIRDLCVNIDYGLRFSLVFCAVAKEGEELVIDDGKKPADEEQPDDAEKPEPKKADDKNGKTAGGETGK